jgi:hypothetical protein
MMSDRDRADSYYRRAFFLPPGMSKPTFYDVDENEHLQPFRSLASVRAGKDSRKDLNLVFSSENTAETLGQKCPYVRQTWPRDLTGKAFGALAPTRQISTGRRGSSTWECRCRGYRGDCGKTVTATRDALLAGAAVDCGSHRVLA